MRRTASGYNINDMGVVTFDFDSTLSRVDVQDYACDLLSRGYDVWVLTSRYDELHKHLYAKNPTLDDLYEVVDRIGISRDKIRFQCMRPKAEWLYNTNVIFHLDDDSVELNDINIETNTVGVSVLSGNYKSKCERILKNNERKQ